MNQFLDDAMRAAVHSEEAAGMVKAGGVVLSDRDKIQQAAHKAQVCELWGCSWLIDEVGSLRVTIVSVEMVVVSWLVAVGPGVGQYCDNECCGSLTGQRSADD